MGDIVGVLLIVGMILGIITAVGHGIWVLLAKLFRGHTPAPRRRGAHESVPACPRCHASLDDDPNECRVCCWPLAAPSDRDQLALVALRKQLERLWQLKWIDAEVYNHFLEAIRAVRHREALLAEQTAAPEPTELVSEIELVEEEYAPPLAAGTVAPHSSAPPSRAMEPGEATTAATDSDELEIEPPIATPEERARQYALRRQQAETDAKTAAARPVLPPREPSKPLAKLLASFMEEKNIRWGELIGGLLIVCCSIALVVSFWSRIADKPLLKFLLFNGITAALFGIGFYIHRRWKLPTTSHGLLIIATLLVPLNFLAIAAFTEGNPTVNAITIAGELVSIGLFTALVFMGGRILVPVAPSFLVLGVLVPAISQLLMRRWVTPTTEPVLLYGLAALPLVCYLAATAAVLVKARRAAELDENECNAIFKMLGMVTFAALLACGLLLAKTHQVAATLQQLAPLVSLAGTPALASGLLLWRRLAGGQYAKLRTAGMSVAIAGAFVVLLGIVEAWPTPMLLAATAGVNVVVFTWIALAFELPAAHLVAALCLAVMYVVGFQVVTGSLAWRGVKSAELLSVVVSARSGTALVGAVVGLGAAAAAWIVRERRSAGLFYGIAAIVCAAVSLGLVIWFGIARVGDPAGLTWVAGTYAFGTLLAARVSRRRELTFVAAALLLLSIAQGVVYWLAPAQGFSDPWPGAVLAHATVCLLLGMVAARGSSQDRVVLGVPLTQCGLAVSWVAVPLLVWLALNAHYAPLAAYLAWLAGLWLMATLVMPSPAMLLAFQAALSLAVVFTVAARLATYSWFAEAKLAWVHPWTLQTQGIALALLSLAWIAVRIALRRWTQFREEFSNVFDPPSLTLDRALQVIVMLVSLALATYGAAPGALQELSPRVGSPAIVATAMSGAVAAPRQVPEIERFELRGIPHAPALELGSWLLLGSVCVLLVASWWDRFDAWTIVGLCVALFAGALLLAGGWESDVAVASALRWYAAGTFLVGSLPIWCRTPLGQVAQRFAWPEWPRQRAVLGRVALSVLLLLAAAPAVGVSLYSVGMALAGSPLLGPEPTSLFARIGLAVSYAVPVIAVALGLVGHASSFRSGSMAVAAALVLSMGVTAAYLLSISKTGLIFDAPQWIRLAQLNASVAGGYALGWLAGVQWFGRRANDARRNGGGWLSLQVMLAVGLNLLVIVPSVLWLALDPIWPGVALVVAADWQGWLAWLLAAASLLWLGRSEGERMPASAACLALLSIASLAALSACRWDTGNWLGFHALLGGYLFVAWGLLVAGWKGAPRSLALTPTLVARWCLAIGVVAALLSLRAAVQDPARPWVSLAGLWLVAGLVTAISAWRARGVLLYLAAPLINAGATIWWANVRATTIGGFGEAVGELVKLNIVALALPTVAWLWMELVVFPRRTGFDARARRLPLHRTTVVLSLALLTFVAGFELWVDLEGWTTTVPAGWAWAALVATTIAVAANLWDAEARLAFEGLYLLGLTAIAIALGQFDLTPNWLAWIGTMLLASYTLLTSYLWSRRRGLAAGAQRLRIPREVIAAAQESTWFVAVNCLMAACVVALVFWVQLTFAERSLRLPASQAAIVQAFAVGLLARGARRSQLQAGALWLGVLGAIAFGWSWLDPGSAGILLNRAVVVLSAIAAMAALYGIGLAKLLRRENEWTRAAERLVPWLVVAGVLSIVLVMALEVQQQWAHGEVVMAAPAITAVCAALAAMCLACLAAALLPGRDPLGLSERGRTAYVYAAEALVAVLFVHIRLSMPWLFQYGLFQRYWPVIVIVLAFAGVGFGELFRRRRQAVLAEPLERTGVFLPLLPVVGYWIVPAQVHYSLLLAAVGILYATLSISRRSFGFGILAALAANGGLWYFLHDQEGLGWLNHPQLWLIPPALCVLAAAYLNREQLGPAQLTAVRYITSTVIYVASTADIFLNGVKNAPWLPLVLAGLSIAGIFAGILLRVRAFLFLGTAFLVLALLTMIWYAAVDLEQTWLWYVSGIVTGILIIVLFAVFEKKRGEVAQLIDRLNDWAP